MLEEIKVTLENIENNIDFNNLEIEDLRLFIYKCNQLEVQLTNLRRGVEKIHFKKSGIENFYY